jgi:hypothetical protein
MLLFSQSRKRTTMSDMTMKSADDQMIAVKAAWDKAPAGPKKNAALKHYHAAEKAQTAKNVAGCCKELDAATLALA